MSINMMNLITVIPIFVFLLILQIYMPKLVRKDIFFGVRIPEDEIDNDELKDIYKSYVRNILLSNIVVIILVSILLLNIESEILSGISIFGILIVNYLIYYMAHKKTKEVKKKLNLGKEKKQYVVVDTRFTASNRGKMLASPVWFILAIIIVGFNVYLTLKYYNVAPVEIPIRWDFSGNVTAYTEKSLISLMFTPLMQMIMVFVLFFVYKSIGWAKQQISVVNPEESKERSRIFRLRTSRFVISIMMVMIITMTITHFTILQIIGQSKVLIIVTTAAIPVVTAAMTIYYVFTTGQGGSRIKFKDDKDKNDVSDRDDDKYWKMGVFYANKNDPSIFVEKRFGIGFTINFGNSWGIVSMIGIIGVIILGVVFGS
jgi:uncharacterized membrane protein